MSIAGKLIPVLESMKHALGVCQDAGPSAQRKPAQNNKASVSAAKANLAKLIKRSDSPVRVAATGAKRK